jgi:hypothetical protein
MIDDPQLARFQALLLDLLSQGHSPEEIVGRLRAQPELDPFAYYIASFEPRMIDVATELTKKWGRREGGMPGPVGQ